MYRPEHSPLQSRAEAYLKGIDPNDGGLYHEDASVRVRAIAVDRALEAFRKASNAEFDAANKHRQAKWELDRVKASLEASLDLVGAHAPDGKKPGEA